MAMLNMNQRNKLLWLLLITSVIIQVACSSGDKPTENIRFGNDPSTYITAPEGRFIVRNALLNLDQWAGPPLYYAPFTELVFAPGSSHVEVINEDLEATDMELIRLGNGHYRLDSSYDLRYNPQSLFWELKIVGEDYPPLVLEGFPMPDTVRLTDISGFKFLAHERLIAGTYFVKNKRDSVIKSQTVSFCGDGQLRGVQRFVKYRLVINGDLAQADLMPIQLFDAGNNEVFYGGIERKDSVLTIYRLKPEGAPDEKPYYRKGEVFATLIKATKQQP